MQFQQPSQLSFCRNINVTVDEPPVGYEFVRLLGQGGFGKVHLARNLFSQKTFAVKCATKTSENTQIVNALVNECSILSKMSHKNIIHCFGLLRSRDGLKWYLFLEHMNQGTVKSLYLQRGPIKEKNVKYLAKETLDGLVYLQSIGIVHRDIKGENILLYSDGMKIMVKLSDFGITKGYYPVDAGGCGLRTKMIGTLSHMAPEIRSTNCPLSYDSRVDIWSLGCTLLEMLTGRIPKIYFNQMGMVPSCSYDRPQHITDSCFMFIQFTLSVNPAFRPYASNLQIHPWIVVNDHINSTNIFSNC